MANLTRRQWRKGWLPCSDNINGDREGLLRMENLRLDDEGIVSLVRGLQRVHGGYFDSYVHTIYSKIMGSYKYRYAALGNGFVLRDGGGGGFNTVVLNGGNVNVAAFDEAYGFVLCCSGKQRKKDNGTEITDLTPAKPSPPVPQLPEQSVMGFFEGAWAQWLVKDGVVDAGPVSGGEITETGADYLVFNTSAAVNLGTVYIIRGNPATTYVGGMGIDVTQDNFKMAVRIGDTTKLESIKIQFLLSSQGGAGETALDNFSEYYTYTWVNSEDSSFPSGLDVWTTLEAKRGDFERIGDDSNLNWDAVYGIVITFNTTGQIENNCLSNMYWYGGPTGQITGTYKYAMVGVNNTGSNLFKSPLSEESEPIYLENACVTIDPGATNDTQVNEIWIFRRDSGVNIDVVPLGTPRRLDQWYRVGTTTPGVSFTDYMSDEEAIELGITWDENMIGTYDIPDDIVSIQANIFGRTLYLTFKELYVSDINDPGLINSAATVKLSGSPAQKNLWVTKVGLGTVYVGTTEDVYEVSGTYATQPDDSVDIFCKPLGIEHPPISYQFTKDNSAVFYMSNDGVRFVGGSETELVTQDVELIFRNYSRYEIGPALLDAFARVSYPLLIGKNNVYVSVPMQDGERWLFVRSLKHKYWYPYRTDPVALFEEEDGTILAGYGGGSGNAIRELDKNDGSNLATLDGVTGQRIVFQTVYDDDNLPRNRKDTFTFKCLAYTGGQAVSIQIAKNGTDSWTEVMNTSFGHIGTNDPQEKLVTIAGTVGLGKQFALRIVGDNIREFKLYHFTIEYDARPEQLTYLRIPYTNLGSISRKRFINFAFVLDTLGIDTTFTPLVDGEVAGEDSVINLNRKGTHVHYFDTETTGTDIGGILCGFFEYYGPNLEEIVSEKMPVPATYLIIPQDDYGTPNRKRHSSYKFIINTRGYNVRFTPRLDGVDQTPLDFTTAEKQVVEYFFTTDTIAINIGGKIESIEDPKEPFEFYGSIKPQQIEVLPPRLKEFRIPENNYGVSARKRVRTMPMEINTYGKNVQFIPIVDHVRYNPTTINTPYRQTTFHYFDWDSFGVDYSGELVTLDDYPFEFYGLSKPENVEVLPVAKRFDQIGPVRLDKMGKVVAFRVRLISTFDTSMRLRVLNEVERTIPNATPNIGEYVTNFPIVPNIDDVYEVTFPKTVNGTVFRFELGPCQCPFHRYDIQVKINVGGMDSDPKWVKIAGIYDSRSARG